MNDVKVVGWMLAGVYALVVFVVVAMFRIERPPFPLSVLMGACAVECTVLCALMLRSLFTEKW